MAVTLLPIWRIVVVPVPAPVFVTEPELLTVPVNEIPPVVAFSLIVRLFVPVTAPAKLVETAVPVLPTVSAPVPPAAR